MILEITTLKVKPGLEEQFEVDFKMASKYISFINGYLKHRLQKVENTNIINVYKKYRF